VSEERVAASLRYVKLHVQYPVVRSLPTACAQVFCVHGIARS
jgi:hypothetical protein